jgi:uncharacterized tellurite resistance protein B-like protein
MAYYKVIEGIRYDSSLLEQAEALTQGSGDGRISFEDAQQLFNEAMDGGKITRVERRTLHHIFEQFKLTDKARSWLAQHMFVIIGELHYDNDLIEAAKLAVEGRGDGRVSLDDAELIWRMVEGDAKITEIERRTIRYILKEFKCTEPAVAFLEGKLA